MVRRRFNSGWKRSLQLEVVNNDAETGVKIWPDCSSPPGLWRAACVVRLAPPLIGWKFSGQKVCRVWDDNVPIGGLKLRTGVIQEDIFRPKGFPQTFGSEFLYTYQAIEKCW